jgi:hypothetical protein
MGVIYFYQSGQFHAPDASLSLPGIELLSSYPYISHYNNWAT